MVAKVSVIMPAYNCENFIEESIGSLLNQTFDDFEIIIVDNRSQDNTLSKIKKLMQWDSRISLVKLDDNYKQGIARNIGVEHAEGEYIMFLDADDKAAPEFIEKMYNKIVSDNSDITICKWAPFNDLTGIVNYKHGFSNFKNLPEKYKKESFNWKDIKENLFSQSNVPWDKIYKKSFLLGQNVKFPGGIFFEDNVFAFDALMKAEKITIMDEYLVFYRTGRKQAVTARCDETFFDYLKTFEHIKQNLINQGTYKEMKYNFLNYKAHSLFWWWKKIDFKYKRKFFNLIKQDYINTFNTELDSITEQRLIYTKTLFLMNRVLENGFKKYLLLVLWDRFFRIEYGVDNYLICILSNFSFWYSNYDNKRVYFD